MLKLPEDRAVFVFADAIDFRKGIDSLAALCRYELNRQPDDGSLFLFCNKRKTAVKILAYDHGGYWLLMKRLSKGKLPYWPKSDAIGLRELGLLLNPKS